MAPDTPEIICYQFVTSGRSPSLHSHRKHENVDFDEALKALREVAAVGWHGFFSFRKHAPPGLPFKAEEPQKTTKVY